MINTAQCWHCDKNFSYTGDKYCDVYCPHCAVMNSFYDPDKQEPERKDNEMAKPPKRADFEKVAIGETIIGTISDIEYDETHTFKFTKKETGEKQEKISYGVRLVFTLDGYEFPHRTCWMIFSYAEKSNLYNKYLAPLVENAKPDMDFDLDNLKGFPIQTVWEENGDFQNLKTILPLREKFKLDEIDESNLEPVEDEPDFS